MDALLEGTEEGRRAKEIVGRYNIKLNKQVSKRGEVYFSHTDSTIYIWWDMRPQEAMYYYIHEAGHAEFRALGKTADIHNLSKEAYVKAMIKEEADVQVRAIRARWEMNREWNNLGGQNQPFNAMTALEQDYIDAYQVYYRQYEKMMESAGNDINSFVADRYAQSAAKKHIEDLWERGEVKASVGGDYYTKYYGDAWERVRSGRPTSGNPGVLPPPKPPPPPPRVTGNPKAHLDYAAKEIKSSGFDIRKGSLEKHKRLESAGSGGSVFGVFPYELPGKKDLVVKVFWPNQLDAMEAELGALKAAEKAGGPRVYGKATYTSLDGDKHVGIVMQKVEGGFADEASGFTGAALDASKAEMYKNAKNITDQTYKDLFDFREELWKQGYYIHGDFQGFVDSAGRWKPIDLASARPINVLDPRYKNVRNAEFLDIEAARDLHNKNFIEMYRKLRKNQDRVQMPAPIKGFDTSDI